MDSKYFTCECRRCTDPTELGSYLSALKCSKCSADNFLLPENPLDLESNWVCSSCPECISVNKASEITARVKVLVDEAMAAPTEGKMENVLKECTAKWVHKNHYLLFKPRHTLLQMYGRTSASYKEDTITKKEKTCQEFLDLCHVIDPSSSHLATFVGVAFYEYEDAIMTRVQKIARREYHDEDQVNKGIALAKTLLQRCIKTLQDEKSDTPGGSLRDLAQKKYIEINLLTSEKNKK